MRYSRLGIWGKGQWGVDVPLRGAAESGGSGVAFWHLFGGGGDGGRDWIVC